jgi:hypothetical protein
MAQSPGPLRIDRDSNLYDDCIDNLLYSRRVQPRQSVAITCPFFAHRQFANKYHV